MNQDGSPFNPRIHVPLPAHVHLNAFLAWREETPSGWIEIGLRAYNLLQARFRDIPIVIRTDGAEMGGQLLGRRMFIYLRGAL